MYSEGIISTFVNAIRPTLFVGGRQQISVRWSI